VRVWKYSWAKLDAANHSDSREACVYIVVVTSAVTYMLTNFKMSKLSDGEVASLNSLWQNERFIRHINSMVAALPRTLLGELITFPRLLIRLGMTPFPIVHPSTPSASHSGHLAFQLLHWSVPIVPMLRNDRWLERYFIQYQWTSQSQFGQDNGPTRNTTSSAHCKTERSPHIFFTGAQGFLPLPLP